MRRFDILDELAAVDCRTLVCVGELDPITPIAAAREIANAYWPLLTEFVRG